MISMRLKFSTNKFLVDLKSQADYILELMNIIHFHHLWTNQKKMAQVVFVFHKTVLTWVY